MIQPTERKLTSVYEVSKSQNIRLLDVFFIAPFMWYFATKAKNVSTTEKITLKLLAAATLYYNGKNYLINNSNK